MHLDLKVRYIKIGTRPEDRKVLCFRHAVLAVITEKAYIEVEVDEFGQSGSDMRQTYCDRCK